MSSSTGGKQAFEITPERLNGFYGIGERYVPKLEHYGRFKIAYGIWDFSIKYQKFSDKVTVTFSGIYRNGFIKFLEHHGFYKHFRSDRSCMFIRCLGNLIEEIEILNISDFVIEYLINVGEDINFSTKINDQEVLLKVSLPLQQETIKKQCNSLFSKKFLELLPTFKKEILRDTPTECYKLFSNKIYKVTKDRIETLDYAVLVNKCVWKKHMVSFNFNFTDKFSECQFVEFIKNVSNATDEPDRLKAFRTAIGYLLHKYNSPQKCQAVICYDETITDIQKPEGGTGKGILAKALSKICEMIIIDGKKFDANDRFCFQRITDSTQIAFFDDVKRKLGFDRFNSLLTDGWNIEKKNKDEFYIRPEDSPKVLISSNSILECEGATRKRRQFILEFSDFYSKKIISGIEEPVRETHGALFFSSEWNQDEWQMFYSFLISCIQEYLRDSLCFYEPKNVKLNRLRQVTDEDFADWIKEEKFEMNKVYEIKPYYESFKSAYYPDEEFSQRKFTGYLKKFATLNGATFKQPKPSSGKTFFILFKDGNNEI